jgi:hypothetical protein
LPLSPSLSEANWLNPGCLNDSVLHPCGTPFMGDSRLLLESLLPEIPFHLFKPLKLSFIMSVRTTNIQEQKLIFIMEGKKSCLQYGSKEYQGLILLSVKCVLLRLTSSVFNRLPSYSLHEPRDVHIKHGSF